MAGQCAWMLREERVRREFLLNGATYTGENSLRHRCEVAAELTPQQKSDAAQHPEHFLRLEVNVIKFYAEAVNDVVEERVPLSTVLDVTANQLLRQAPLYRAYLLSREVEGGPVDITPEAAKALYSSSTLGQDADPEIIKAVLKRAAEEPGQNRRPTERVVRRIAKEFAAQLRQQAQRQEAEQADRSGAGGSTAAYTEALCLAAALCVTKFVDVYCCYGGLATSGGGAAAQPAVPANGGKRGRTEHRLADRPQSGARDAEAAAGPSNRGQAADGAAATTRERRRGQQQPEQDEQQNGDQVRLRQRPRTAPVGGTDFNTPIPDALLDLQHPGRDNPQASPDNSHHSTARYAQQRVPRRRQHRQQQPARVAPAAQNSNHQQQRDARQERRQQEQEQLRQQQEQKQQQQQQQQQLAAERNSRLICRLRDIVRIKDDSVEKLGPNIRLVISQWMADDAVYVALSTAGMSDQLRKQLTNERLTVIPLDSLPALEALPALPANQGLHYMADQVIPVEPLPAKWPANQAAKAGQLLRQYIGNVVLGETETVLIDLHRDQQLHSHAVALDTGLLVEMPIKQVFGWVDFQEEPWVETQ